MHQTLVQGWVYLILIDLALQNVAVHGYLEGILISIKIKDNLNLVESVFPAKFNPVQTDQTN